MSLIMTNNYVWLWKVLASKFKYSVGSHLKNDICVQLIAHAKCSNLFTSVKNNITEPEKSGLQHIPPKKSNQTSAVLAYNPNYFAHKIDWIIIIFLPFQPRKAYGFIQG